jgi:TRAP-type C4-dicarboxylate transport system substrate-binding protein
MGDQEKKRLNFFAFFLAAGCLLLAGMSQPGASLAQETIKWRMQSVWPSGSEAYDWLVPKICEDIEKKTEGRIKITPYPSGALAKVMQTFDNVAAGTIDIGFSTGLYHTRKIPEALVESGLPFSFTGPPFSYAPHEQNYAFFYEYENGEAIQILREAYAKRGVHLLAAGPTSSYGFMTKFKAQTLSDFKGKKIRTFGLFSALAKEMGASPVSIPGAEQYMALSRGTIDGTLYPYYVLETYKLKEVVNYAVIPPVLASPVLEFYINAKEWEELPEDLRQVVQETFLEDLKQYSRRAVELDQKYVEKAKEAGVEVVRLEESSVERLNEMAIPLWDSVAKKSEGCRRLVELLKAYLDVE